VTLGFHEGTHGTDQIRYLETHPLPAFTGKAGDTEAAFNAAYAKWQADLALYGAAMAADSEVKTDCVGVTIDQANQAAAPAGTTVPKQCPP
jgi:hypothetical protein